jgi:integrase
MLRQLAPLTVEQQRKLILSATDRQRPLIILLLSTGMHPVVLSKKKYEFSFTEDYYQWKRPKKLRNNIVRGTWSRMMRGKGILEAVESLRGLTTQGYWYLVNDAGNKAGISPVGPLRLRHSNLTNHARLNHDRYTTAAMAATSVDTIEQYYTIGINELGILTEQEKEWLKELMER